MTIQTIYNRLNPLDVIIKFTDRKHKQVTDQTNMSPNRTMIFHKTDRDPPFEIRTIRWLERKTATVMKITIFFHI